MGGLLASLGRYGDTEIRNIDGMPAHLTEGESNLYDNLGEGLATPIIKRIGSGTTNPRTNLIEYHQGGTYDFIGHPMHHDYYWTGNYPEENTSSGPSTPPPHLSYERLSGLSPDRMGSYLEEFGLESEDREFFRDIFQEEPFGFMKKGAGLAQEGLLGQTKQGVRDIYSQVDKMKTKSGFATSGDITQRMQHSMDTLLSGYDMESKGIRLGLDKSMYEEKQRQTDEFYNMITNIRQFT